MQPDQPYNNNPNPTPQQPPATFPPAPDQQPQAPSQFPTEQQQNPLGSQQYGTVPPAQPLQQPYAPVPQPMPNFQPSAVPQAQTNHGNKKIVITVVIVAAVLVLAGLGYWIYGLLNKSGSNPVSSVVNSVTGNSDVEDRSDGKLNLGALVDEAEIIKDQDLKAKINQQINRSDGVSYMVTKVERNWKSTSTFLKGHSGKEYIKITVVIGNRSKKSSQFISDNMFKVVNSAGGLQSSEYATKDEVSDILEHEELAPGKQTSGALIFEIDSGEVVSLSTEDAYSKIGGTDSGKKVTIKTQVTLQ